MFFHVQLASVGGVQGFSQWPGVLCTQSPTKIEVGGAVAGWKPAMAQFGHMGYVSTAGTHRQYLFL